MIDNAKNFKTWFENADIPKKDREINCWYDAETGLRYDENIDYVSMYRVKRKSVDSVTLSNREIAKKLGAKALEGSAKQKKWAEQIRADKIKSLSQKDAKALVNCQLFTHSKFWIENREKSAKDMIEFLNKKRSLHEKFNNAGDIDERTALSLEHNSLTKIWGF